MTGADARPDEVACTLAAEVLGISRQKLATLQREGFIPRTRHGRTGLVSAMAGLIRWLGQEAERAAAPAPAGTLPDLPAELAVIGDRAGRRLRAAGADLPALRRVLAAVETAAGVARDA